MNTYGIVTLRRRSDMAIQLTSSFSHVSHWCDEQGVSVMRIHDESPDRLTLIEPNTGHKMFFGLVAVGFGIGTVGIAISGDAPLAAAAIPAVISLGGIAGLWYGGKPDVTTFDRGANQLRTVTHSGSFSKPEFTEYRLSDFTAVTIEANRAGSRTTYGIFLTYPDGEPVQIGMSERPRRKMEQRMEQIASFLGIPTAN
jgi:hypothetical protein